MATPPPLREKDRPGRLWRLVCACGRAVNGLRLVVVNLVFLILLSVILAIAWMTLSPVAHHVPDNSVLLLKPEGQLVDQYRRISLQQILTHEYSKQIRLRDLLRVINAAAIDPRITQIVLDPSQMQSTGFASLRELGVALDHFRAHGKRVLAWASSFSQKQYYLAIHADQVLLDPKGELMLTGLSNYHLFYKGLIDKLGVQVHVFRVGKFKSAVEPYLLSQASAASKKADRFWLGGIWNDYLGEVARHRHISVATLREDMDALPVKISSTSGSLAQLALHEHLIDATVTPSQLIAILHKRGVPLGPKGFGIRSVSFKKYMAALPMPGGGSTPGVTVVVAEGDIQRGWRLPGAIGGASTAALIRTAREDKRTRALVLRVNSPGGDVYASEQIRREVALTRAAHIPVVVSMGDVAASGGYWISMNASRIVAEPNTITGSIGIFGLYYSLPQSLAKLGIRSDGVATGTLAGAFDVTRPLSPAVAHLIQAMINKGYHDFISGVARARGQSLSAVAAIAQGRVWTGRQAMQRGLVDRLGGLHTAIIEAAKLAGLPDAGYPVRYQSLPLNRFQRTLGDLGQGVAQVTLQRHSIAFPVLPHQWRRLTLGLNLLRRAEPGKPHIYAYCFCVPH